MLCPGGAPTLAFLDSYEEFEKFDVTKGSDQLVAELSKADSEYDIIVAPVNLGTKLISAGKSEYRLDGVVTWGNLYLVGTNDADVSGEGDILLFGEGSVPAKVFDASGVGTSLNKSYVGDASMVSADLLSGKANLGMLAEPVVTATIAKAKKQNLELNVLVDLQEAYQKAQNSNEYGFPQAAVFVRKGLDISNLTNRMASYSEGGLKDAETYLNKIGVETLGLPDAKVVVSSIERQNVHYKKASDVKEQLKTFLNLFNIAYTDDMLNE